MIEEKSRKELTVDPEFERICHKLTSEEFTALENTILEKGEILSPIITWNGIIVDGHHRYKIAQKHPEIPYKTTEIDFPDRSAAIAWICNTQLGRRNINKKQANYLIGQNYEAEKQMQNLHGNRYTKNTWCKTVDVEEGSNVTLTYRPWRDNKDYVFDGWYEDPEYTKKIYSVDIKNHEVTGSYQTRVYGRWIYTGEPDEEEKDTGIGRGIVVPLKNSSEVVTVYPVSEYFYIIIRGEVRWLKEMFDVEMLIINNSNTDTLENLTATLSLPEGLSLATMVGDQQTLSKEIEKIAEGQCETLHWFVRGDTAGSYDIEARLQGTVMPFEEPIDNQFKAKNKLQVWAGNALHLHFEFPDAAYYGEDYPITITLTNVSDITLYNINHKVQIEQGMEIYYSDGTSKKKIEKSAWESIGVKEFHPGDQLIIEASVNIFFKSEMIQYELEKLIGMVDGIEQLINAYKAVKTGLDIASGLVNAISGASKAIDSFISNPTAGLESKLELAEALKDKLGDFMLKYSKFDNATFDAVIRLANSGVGTTLNIINQDPDEWLKNAAEDDIKDLIKRISALENSIVSDTSNQYVKNFDIYDSIRTLIEAIPVRFVLKRVIMTEDEDIADFPVMMKSTVKAIVFPIKRKYS